MVDYLELFKSVVDRHKNAQKWDNAIFSGIKSLSNTKVGTVGQDFIEELCNTLDLEIEFPVNIRRQRLTQSPWDIKLHGITFELKTATEDTGGKFQFNHIRYHRNYQAVLCLGVSPNDLFFNLWSKADVATGRAGRLVTMEKGANASYKLTKSKQELFEIKEFAERLESFANSFS